MEQSDIVPVLKSFQVQIDDADCLVITNPPTIKVDKPAPKKESPGIKITEKSYTSSNVKDIDIWSRDSYCRSMFIIVSPARENLKHGTG